MAKASISGSKYLDSQDLSIQLMENFTLKSKELERSLLLVTFLSNSTSPPWVIIDFSHLGKIINDSLKYLSSSKCKEKTVSGGDINIQFLKLTLNKYELS